MRGGIMYKQKDIVLMPFPFSDLTASKKRPAIIISNQTINKTEDCICCLITSQKPNLGTPIQKTEIEKGNLPFKSWIKPHRIFTINQKIILKKLAHISDKKMKELKEKINQFL
jgi:mRNA interferase MazF